jgi:drug/metabolite transporter (DMT)-like permease
MIVSAAAFGVMPILARYAFDSGTEPFTVLCLRFASATLVMLALCAIFRTRFPRGRTLVALVVLGGVLYVGQALCYFVAITLAPTSLVALILYLYPGLVAAGEAIVYRRRITAVKAVALGLALCGAVLMIGFVRGGSVPGILLSVGAALIYSVYILIGDRVMKDADPLAATTVVIASTAVVYAVIMVIRGPVWPGTTTGWLSVAGLSLVSTVIAVGAFFAGLRVIGPTSTATISAMEPAVAVTLSFVLLGEQLTVLKVVGAALILAAVVLIARSGAKKAPGNA